MQIALYKKNKKLHILYGRVITTFAQRMLTRKNVFDFKNVVQYEDVQAPKR